MDALLSSRGDRKSKELAGQPDKPRRAKALRLLLVEDSEDDAELVLLELRRGGYDVSSARVDNAEDMRDRIEGDVRFSRSLTGLAR